MTTKSSTNAREPDIGIARAGLSGVLAGAGALAAGELLAALWPPRPGPVVAVANRVIEFAPTWFVNFGKSIFGLADKPALVLGTIIIALIAAAGLGIASRLNRSVGALGIGAFGLLGFLAIGSDAQAGWLSAFFFAIVSAVTGIRVLLWLLDAASAPSRRVDLASNSTTAGDPRKPGLNRRGFLGVAGGVGAGIAVAGLAGNWLRGRSAAETARSAVVLTGTSSEASVAELIAAANQHPVALTPGISPAVVPGDDFYLIDTAIIKPQIDPADWSLTIDGMVDNPLKLSYQDLIDRASVTAPVTLSCVSNEVGGGLVGNAVWQGVPLTELLEEAGVQDGATQIKSQSVDGWNCGFPTDLAFDGRTALVAVAMNGEPLPVKHGFPVRLVVSGLYGYVSATKWLESITLTTLEDFDGYWVPRGWSKDGPVKTQSRIDTPRTRSSGHSAAEPLPIAGVAWAPNTGIETVEVQIDSGPWEKVELGESMGINSWRQWRYVWQNPIAGVHAVRVRATDQSGYTQTSEKAPVAPDGATGWHTIQIEVG